MVIPPGTYRIRPPAQGSHLQFHDLADFAIDARGVEWIFTDQRRGGIEFRNCRNVTLRGAGVRYEVPPFTQGVVEAIAPSGAWYDIAIEKGYPSNLDDPAYFPANAVAYLFDPKSRWWRPGTYDLNGQRIERRGPGHFRVYWQRPSGPQLHPVETGDPICFRGSGPHNITVLNCGRMTLEGVTVFNAASFAIWEGGGEGGNRYSVTITRGPRPPGALTDPLLSSTADAFHSTSVRRGPILDNCHFEAMGDDGIAIHGTYSFVLEGRGNKLIVSQSNFRAGDPLRLFDPGGHPAGEASVTSVRPLEAYRNSRKSRRVAQSDNTTGPYFEVTLDAPLAADFDYLASNPAATGSGYVLRNNTISNHRARGMLLKADNGLVEGNTIDGSTMGGIVLTPEFWWNESCYSRNVIIRGNVIRRVARAPGQLGAVVVAAIDKAPVPGCGHRNILLENNRFEDLGGVNLFISSACDVTVKNNTFLSPQLTSASIPLFEWWRPVRASLIFMTEVRKIRFESNVVSGNLSKSQLVQFSRSGQVEGAEGGFTIR